jgi:hypothetical protein
MPLTESNLPLVVEFTADATGVGKTLAALRIRHHLDQAGIHNVLVRIESRGVGQPLRQGDVFIAVEDFANAARMAGGLAGVLAPMSAAIIAAARNRSVVLVDWAGGLAQHHLEHLAQTRFDEQLAGMHVTGLCIGVTTNRLEHMRQAAANLRAVATTAPGMHRGLLLNSRFGTFNFIAGSQPATAYRDLLKAAQNDCALLRFPAVVGESWKTAEDAKLTLPEVVRCSPSVFAKRTGLDPFTAAACITEVGAWLDLTREELQRVLRFRATA